MKDNHSKVSVPSYVAKWLDKQIQIAEPEDDYTDDMALSDSIHFTIYNLYANLPETNSDVQDRKPVLEWLDKDRMNYFKLFEAVKNGYQTENVITIYYNHK